MCPPHLQTLATLPWEVQNGDLSKKVNNDFDCMLIFQHFHSIHHFKTDSYGILLACVTVSVQSDLIRPELQQHLFQRWTAFQQCIVDELIEQWHMSVYFEHWL